jgi:hypothetical protein
MTPVSFASASASSEAFVGLDFSSLQFKQFNLLRMYYPTSRPPPQSLALNARRTIKTKMLIQKHYISRFNQALL